MISYQGSEHNCLVANQPLPCWNLGEPRGQGAWFLQARQFRGELFGLLQACSALHHVIVCMRCLPLHCFSFSTGAVA
jgi:hypothetical protein